MNKIREKMSRREKRNGVQVHGLRGRKSVESQERKRKIDVVFVVGDEDCVAGKTEAADPLCVLILSVLLLFEEEGEEDQMQDIPPRPLTPCVAVCGTD